ncbi:substrate binding domain-containing protein [Burkholderia sp. Ax-1719]|uniref:substrate binding domain-containing protein n=1 Tax=Burkholderia sp. Ax-1719 TaxID=2608334 RepID=UPI0031F48D6A
MVRIKLFRAAKKALPTRFVHRRIRLDAFDEIRIREHHRAVGFEIGDTRSDVRADLVARSAGTIQHQRARPQLGEMLAQPSGVLRVSMPVDFGVTYLAPLMVEFAELYPGISFDLDLTSRRIDLVSERFDVALRIGESEDSQLIARPLACLTPYLFASPGYLKRSGEPAKPADLVHHECLTILKASEWTMHADKPANRRSMTVPVSGRFALNSVGMIRRLAVLDRGIVLMPQEVVADDLASGALLPVLPGWHGDAVPIYAITETRLLPAKVQRFIEFLQARLAS